MLSGSESGEEQELGRPRELLQREPMTLVNRIIIPKASFIDLIRMSYRRLWRRVKKSVVSYGHLVHLHISLFCDHFCLKSSDWGTSQRRRHSWPPSIPWGPPGRMPHHLLDSSCCIGTECCRFSWKPLPMSECVLMSSTIFSKSLSDVVDGQSSMMVSVCLL